MRELLYIATAAKIRRQEAAREVWEIWDNQTSYKVGNKVEFDGSSYIYHTDAPAGTLPTDPVYTTLIAARGAPGPQGETGAPGPQGETGQAGQSAYEAAQIGGYNDTLQKFYADLAAMEGLADALEGLL